MILIIGIGNPDRGDDAAGPAVARRVQSAVSRRDVTVTELVGDIAGLLDAWTGARTVYVIDAVFSEGMPGAVYRFDAADRLPPRFRHHGTHTYSLSDVIELARALGRLPERLICYGIEGKVFELGAPVSPGVKDAITAVTEHLVRETRELKAGG